MRFLLPILAVLALLSCSTRPPEEGINEKYLDPGCDPLVWNRSFEDPKKDTVLHRREIFQRLPLKNGEVVADVGAGTGSFLAGLAEKVGPRGKVYAEDIAPNFIDFMKRRIRQEKLSNVEVVKGTQESTGLPGASVDVVLTVDAYHHFERPEKMLADFKRALRKGGRLVVVDFDREKTTHAWVKEHVRRNKAAVIEEIEGQGLAFQGEAAVPFAESFMLIFLAK